MTLILIMALMFFALICIGVPIAFPWEPHRSGIC